MTFPSPLRTRSLRGMLAGLFLAGTAAGAVTAETAQPAAIDNSPAKGTIQLWVGGVDNLTPILKDFEAANPGVDVKVTAIPEGNFDSKVLSAIASGAVPDLIRMPFITALTDISSGGFSPVPADLIDPKNFPAGAIAAGTYKGQLYSVPWTIAAPALLYRKDLAEAAGVQPPKTWDELKTFAAALQKQGATYGLGLGVGYDQYTAADLRDYIHQAGGSVLNADGTKWTLDTPEAAKAMDFMYHDLIQSGLVSADGPKFLDITPWFTQGKVGSIVNGVWMRDWLTKANGADWVKTHLAAAPFPAGPGGEGMTMSGNGLVVPQGAANADAAWKLARYLTQVGPQVKFYQLSSLLPANNDAWSDPAMQGDAYLAAFRDALKTALPPVSAPTWGEVAGQLGKSIEYVARGNKTAEQALKAVQRRADRIGTSAE